MVLMIGLALALILAGLVMAYLSPGLKRPLLTAVVYWAGVALVVLGLILLVAPVIVWLAAQIRSAIGQ